MAARADKDERRRNAELLARLLAGKRGVLLAQARKHAQLPDDAEEALQSAYILFIERYDPRYRPLPWLQTTVKREAWRIAKRASRRRELGVTAVPRGDGHGTTDLTDAFPDPNFDLSERLEDLDTTRARRKALECLKRDERTALLLLALGYSYAEIADLRGWTHTKVNRCAYEGRAALRAREAEH